MEVVTTIPSSLNSAALGLREARSKSDVNSAAVFDAFRRQLGICCDPTQHELIEREDRSIVPSIASADQLFHSARMLPLKLPPRLQIAADGGASRGGRLHSPTSAISVALASRSPFGRFGTNRSRGDPFMAALEKVRKEESPPRAKARPLSPLRNSSNRLRKQDVSCSSSNTPSGAQQSAERAAAITSALFGSSKVGDGSGNRMSSCCCKVSKRNAIKHFETLQRGRKATGGTLRDQAKGVLRKRSMAPWRVPSLCFGCS